MKMRLTVVTICALSVLAAPLSGAASANPLCGLEVLGHRPCFQLP
jgi:hypothetical protein